jgi:glycine/serine hydroxymethyltransferase
MKEADMEKIAEMISDMVSNPTSEDVKKSVRKRIDDLTSEHPLYPELFTW